MHCMSNKNILALDKNNERFYPLVDHGKWGFTNEDGKQVIECKFDSVDFFFNGLAIAKSGEKYGYINQKGEWHLKPKYEGVTRFYRDYTSVKKNNKYKIINRKGKKVKEEIFPFSTGCVISYPTDPKKHSVKKEGKYELVYEYYIQYDSLNHKKLTDTTNLQLDSLIGYGRNKILVKKNDKYGFYTVKPNQPIIIQYEAKKDSSQEAKSIVNTQIDFIYDDIKFERFMDNEIFVAKVRIGDKWGMINGSGQTTVEAIYHSIKLESGIYALAEYEKNKFGYVKFGGKEYFKRTVPSN